MKPDRKILRRAAVAAVIVVCFLVVLVLNLTADSGDGAQGDSDELKYYTDFSLETLDGGSFTQEDLKDYKVTVINAWAPWCGPCVNELPVLQALSEEYEKDGIQVVGVAADYFSREEEDYAEQIREAVEAAGVTYPILLTDNSFLEAYYTMDNSLPCTWAVDSKGNLIGQVIGAQSEDGWRRCFAKWLNGR